MPVGIECPGRPRRASAGLRGGCAHGPRNARPGPPPAPHPRPLRFTALLSAPRYASPKNFPLKSWIMCRGMANLKDSGYKPFGRTRPVRPIPAHGKNVACYTTQFARNPLLALSKPRTWLGEVLSLKERPFPMPETWNYTVPPRRSACFSQRWINGLPTVATRSKRGHIS